MNIFTTIKNMMLALTVLSLVGCGGVDDHHDDDAHPTDHHFSAATEATEIDDIGTISCNTEIEKPKFLSGYGGAPLFSLSQCKKWVPKFAHCVADNLETDAKHFISHFNVKHGNHVQEDIHWALADCSVGAEWQALYCNCIVAKADNKKNAALTDANIADSGLREVCIKEVDQMLAAEGS